MSFANTPPLSLRNGSRWVLEDNVTVEEVLVVVGDQIGHENKAVVVFLKEKSLVSRLIVSGLVINYAFVQLSPLYTPPTKVTISNVLPLVSDEV